MDRQKIANQVKLCSLIYNYKKSKENEIDSNTELLQREQVKLITNK